MTAHVRVRGGEERRKWLSGRRKRKNVLKKLEARKLLPELLPLGNSSTLNRFVLCFSRALAPPAKFLLTF